MCEIDERLKHVKCHMSQEFPLSPTITSTAKWFIPQKLKSNSKKVWILSEGHELARPWPMHKMKNGLNHSIMNLPVFYSSFQRSSVLFIKHYRLYTATWFHYPAPAD